MITDVAMRSFLKHGIFPAVGLAAIAVPFHIHYRQEVSEYLNDLELRVKTFVYSKFVDPLTDREPGIRSVEDAELPLSSIRKWGRLAYQRQYFAVALRNAFLFAMVAAVCWLAMQGIRTHLEPTATMVTFGQSVTLRATTVQNALEKAAYVSAFCFIFFALTVVLKFELWPDD